MVANIHFDSFFWYNPVIQPTVDWFGQNSVAVQRFWGAGIWGHAGSGTLTGLSFVKAGSVLNCAGRYYIIRLKAKSYQ